MTAQIIRTREELAALDPDTLVTLALPAHDKARIPQVQAWPAPVAHRYDLTWSGPMVVIATGMTAALIATHEPAPTPTTTTVTTTTTTPVAPCHRDDCPPWPSLDY